MAEGVLLALPQISPAPPPEHPHATDLRSSPGGEAETEGMAQPEQHWQQERRGKMSCDDAGKTSPANADFDASKPPPFGIGEIRAAIPRHCWVKNPWRSLGYVARDAVAIAMLATAAARADCWAAWPVYWLAQGTLFWAVFVLGHDCGHGSFSDSKLLNNVVGHLLHSFILVPYHGWRISHKTHHQNHGHVENDESWHPIPESLYKKLDESTLRMRFTLPFPLLAYPVYLMWRSPGKKGSHFHPASSLFARHERTEVAVSTVCWTAMMCLLADAMWVFGPLPIIKLYWIPLAVFVIWLDLVTYLHHHGHQRKLPWYRGQEWSYLRGALTTVDRDYGFLNSVHHNIETHVIHHLFPQIPHYNLVEATKAAKPVLGKYYRQPEKSGPLPFHLIGILMRSLRADHFVSDEGDVVFYQTDPRFSGKLE